MIFEKLQLMVAKQLGMEKSKIAMESDILKDIGADSLDMVEMLLAVEEEWGIEIDDNEVADIRTIADVVKFISEKSNKK